jgi:hypothetical protein
MLESSQYPSNIKSKSKEMMTVQYASRHSKTASYLNRAINAITISIRVVCRSGLTKTLAVPCVALI